MSKADSVPSLNRHVELVIGFTLLVPAAASKETRKAKNALKCLTCGLAGSLL